MKKKTKEKRMDGWMNNSNKNIINDKIEKKEKMRELKRKQK